MANQSTFAAPQKADNWRAVVGNKLPDGTTDVTEGIYHDGAVHLGNANISGSTRFKHLGIASYTGNGTFTSQVIQTNIPKDSYIMPSIDLKGYAYEQGNTVDVQLGLYTYTIPSGSIINTVWQSKGTSSPLAIRAGWNASNLLALEITWATSDDYFNRYGIDAYSDGNSGAQQDSWFENWTITNTLFDASFTQVVTVAKKDKAAAIPFATPAETIAGTSTTLAVNPADLYARENIPAQTGLSNNLASIPAPTAGQSPFGVTACGKVIEHIPNVGWKSIAEENWSAAANWGACFPSVAAVAGQVLITSPAISITNPDSCKVGHYVFTIEGRDNTISYINSGVLTAAVDVRINGGAWVTVGSIGGSMLGGQTLILPSGTVSRPGALGAGATIAAEARVICTSNSAPANQISGCLVLSLLGVI